MANHDELIGALESLGANVDRKNFSTKMQDPKFAEDVRNALQGAGATVSDSSTFYQKYSGAATANQGTDDASLFKQIQNATLTSGYSGLSDEHKLALDNALMNVKAQNPNAFTSIDDVHSQMDKEAGVDIRSKVGRTLRTPLAGIVGTVEGAAGALGGAVGAQSGNRLEQAKEQGLNAAMEGLTAGKEGRGLEGMASDPANLIPAVGLEKLGANLASRVALRGLEGAAYGVTSNALNPSEEFNPLVSGVAGAAGAQVIPMAKGVILAPFKKSIASKAENEASRQAMAEIEDAAIRGAAKERALQPAPELRQLSPAEEADLNSMRNLLSGTGNLTPKKANVIPVNNADEFFSLLKGAKNPNTPNEEDIIAQIAKESPDPRIGSEGADVRATLDAIKDRLSKESPYTAMPSGYVTPSDEAALLEYAKIKNLKQEGTDLLGLFLNPVAKNRLSTWVPSSVMKSLTDNTALPNSAVKLTDALQGVDPILYRGLLSGVLSKVLEDKSKNQKDPKSENLTINKILK